MDNPKESFLVRDYSRARYTEFDLRICNLPAIAMIAWICPIVDTRHLPMDRLHVWLPRKNAADV